MWRDKGTSHRVIVQKDKKGERAIESISHDPQYIYCKTTLTGLDAWISATPGSDNVLRLIFLCLRYKHFMPLLVIFNMLSHCLNDKIHTLKEMAGEEKQYECLVCFIKTIHVLLSIGKNNLNKYIFGVITHLEPDMAGMWSQVGLRKHYYEQSRWRWWNSIWAISNPKRWCCESAVLNMTANLEKSAMATGLEKVSFHFNLKERQCQRMLKLPQLHSSHTLAK